jgi:hypothetical protein
LLLKQLASSYIPVAPDGLDLSDAVVVAKAASQQSYPCGCIGDPDLADNVAGVEGAAQMLFSHCFCPGGIDAVVADEAASQLLYP